MKNLIKINIVIVIAIAVCNKIHGQQRASDRSFNRVLMEVKRQQAMRTKMLQQARQSTPEIGGSNTVIAPANTNAGATQPTNASSTRTSQQTVNDETPTKPILRPKAKDNTPGKL